MTKARSYILLLLLTTSICFGQTGTLWVNVHPAFGKEDLILSDKMYVTANGDSIHVDVFKFYLSSLCLNGSKTFCEKESYHLIDAEDPKTLSILIKNIPNGDYENLSFALGVDSLKNTQGVLTGDLDPIKGMYWAWNTGYIAAKLEGTSKVCKTLHNAFEFHIGGYLPPFSSFRTGTLPVTIKVNSNTAVLDIFADVAEWFVGPQIIDLSKTNSIVIPDKRSAMMADNYSDMIKLKK
jgi:hypothetical protein